MRSRCVAVAVRVPVMRSRSSVTEENRFSSPSKSRRPCVAGTRQRVWSLGPDLSHLPISSCIIKPVIAHPSAPFSGPVSRETRRQKEETQGPGPPMRWS